MSSRIFQNQVMQIKDAANVDIGVIDSEGNIIASSNLKQIGEKWSDSITVLNSYGGEMATWKGKTFKSFVMGGGVTFALFVEGDDDAAAKICAMAEVVMESAKIAYDEKHDRAAFVKNVITYNILVGDVYIRARELNFPADVPRAAFLVRQEGKPDVAVLDVLNNLFPDKQHDYVISIGERDIAVIKEVSVHTDAKELQKIASEIQEAVTNELGSQIIVGIGSVATHLRDLADAYKKAQVAIDVGKIFDTEKDIISYDNLGVGRLIYQLPTTLCEIFLSEVFKKNPVDSLDAETLYTINKFFENNLNVSETSRKLFVHRNTLVYRLEKIKKLTGLDLREFDHAIVFKVALMVKKYLVSREAKM